MTHQAATEDRTGAVNGRGEAPAGLPVRTPEPSARPSVAAFRPAAAEPSIERVNAFQLSLRALVETALPQMRGSVIAQVLAGKVEQISLSCADGHYPPRAAWKAFLEALITEDVPLTLVGSTRADDIVRDADLLPLYRKAGWVRFLLGMENTD